MFAPFLIANTTYFSTKEFADVRCQVEHKSCCAGVWLCQCDADAESLDLDTGTSRETRQQSTLIRRHIGACAVVITDCSINVVGRQKLNAKDKMTEQVSPERIFLDKFTRRVILVGRFIVRFVPFAHVVHGGRDAHWQPCELL